MGLVCSNNLQEGCTEFNQCISNGVMLMTSENYDQRWSKGFPSSHPKCCAAVGPPPGAALVWRSRLSARGKETKWALPKSRLLWQGLLHLIYSDRLSARLLCLGYSFSGISGARCVSYPAPCPLHHSEGLEMSFVYKCCMGRTSFNFEGLCVLRQQVDLGTKRNFSYLWERRRTQMTNSYII